MLKKQFSSFNSIYMMIFFIIFPLLASGQNIKVVESDEMVMKNKISGMYVLIILDQKTVEKAWSKYLKNYGKTENVEETVQVPIANMLTIYNYPVKIISTISSSAEGTKVWWAIDLTETYLTSKMPKEFNEAKQMLYEFAVNCYKDDINKQIEDAEIAVEKSTKAHEKEVQQGIDLADALEKNKKEKITLESDLVKNKEENAKLNRELDFVIKEQKISIEKIDRIKKESDPTNPNASAQDQLTKALKEQQKLSKKAEDLNNDLEKNKNNNQRLNDKLLKNSNEFQYLNQEITQNKIDIAALAEDVEKMKTALEIVKEKLHHIEN